MLLSVYLFKIERRNHMNAKKVFGDLVSGAKQNSPAILTGLTVVGLAITAYRAYKAGIVASDILKKHKEDMELVKPDDKEAKRAVIKETVKEMAPVVAPVIIMGTVTGACAIGAQSINGRRIAALSAAYTVTEKSLKDLNLKMQDMLGAQKARAVKDAVAKDKLKSAGIPKENQIVVTGGGDVLCKDEYSGRFFRSNAAKIDQAVNKLNNTVRCCRYVSLNDFYDLIGLERIPLGRDLGWNEEDTIAGGCLPITFTAILNDNNEPVLCVEYDIHIRRDYRELH